MNVKRTVLMVSIVVCAAGVASAQTLWEDYPVNPILGPGDPGEWDEGGRLAGSVVYDGSIWHLYYVNWDPGTSGSEAIGHATSTNGLPPWEPDYDNNPVLSPGDPGAWDEDGLFLPNVIFDGAMFHMWYSGGQGVYFQGGYATSPDGSTWTKHPGNPVFTFGPPGSWDDRHARPGTVIADSGTLKMWYSGLGSANNVQIGYAESMDGGITWIKHPVPVLEETTAPVWDQIVANPSVVMTGSMYYMLYAASVASPIWIRIGCAFSSDGIQWQRYKNPVISIVGEDTFASPVIFDGSTFHTWYGHVSFDTGVMVTSYAISTDLVFADDFENGSTSLWSTTVP